MENQPTEVPPPKSVPCPDSYVEILTLSVRVFGDRPVRR